MKTIRIVPWMTLLFLALRPAIASELQQAPLPSISPTSVEQWKSQYILDAGDKINILVLGYPEFDGTQEVLPDGTISLPFIGSVTASGYTLESLSRELESRLSEWLNYPQITLSISERRAVIVNLMGEVVRPGPIQILDNSLSLSSAISQAGGVKRSANISEVRVTRLLADGRKSSITVNLWDAVWSEELADVATTSVLTNQNVKLRDGDEIFIPRTSGSENLDPRIVSSSTIAPQSIEVRVIGEVRTPGVISVTPDSTLSNAIASAGGPTEDAALSRVQFIRLNEPGEITSEELDLGNLIDEKQVQPGDVLIVPKRNSSIILDNVTRILNPFRLILSIFN